MIAFLHGILFIYVQERIQKFLYLGKSPRNTTQTAVKFLKCVVPNVSMVDSYICNTLEIVGQISLLVCIKENNVEFRFFARVSQHMHDM